MISVVLDRLFSPYFSMSQIKFLKMTKIISKKKNHNSCEIVLSFRSDFFTLTIHMQNSLPAAKKNMSTEMVNLIIHNLKYAHHVLSSGFLTSWTFLICPTLYLCDFTRKIIPKSQFSLLYPLQVADPKAGQFWLFVQGSLSDKLFIVCSVDLCAYDLDKGMFWQILGWIVRAIK